MYIQSSVLIDAAAWLDRAHALGPNHRISKSGNGGQVLDGSLLKGDRAVVRVRRVNDAIRCTCVPSPHSSERWCVFDRL